MQLLYIKYATVYKHKDIPTYHQTRLQTSERHMILLYLCFVNQNCYSKTRVVYRLKISQIYQEVTNKDNNQKLRNGNNFKMSETWVADRVSLCAKIDFPAVRIPYQ